MEECPMGILMEGATGIPMPILMPTGATGTLMGHTGVLMEAVPLGVIVMGTVMSLKIQTCKVGHLYLFLSL